ncbi:MAG: carboxypeptidase M32 [Anaerolineae bacterium]|nr:carboxypeptidase M32 [Anaerolineae bacterium]
MSAYPSFREHIAQINDLLNVFNILNWDSHTQMPHGGAETRGHQLATIVQLAQERFASDTTARLLDAVEAEVEDDDYYSYRRREVQNTRWAYDIARRIPAALMSKIVGLRPTAEQAWVDAKKHNDFTRFAPYLTQAFDYQKQLAEAIGYVDHPYDALLLRYEPEMNVERLRHLFDIMKGTLLPLLQNIVAKGDVVRSDFLYGDFDEAKQREFALGVAQQFGYDLNRGRLDVSAHPFEVSFTRNDVRITTRYQRNYLPGALFGVLHEAGHALYEQGASIELTRTALTTDFLGNYAVAGVSFGAHESQSRLWENQVGRSRAFWQLHFPRLQSHFASQLAGVDAESFYRAVNRVRPSFIRVEADEMTYNFHIMLRVEIEIGLLDGSIKVSDLPELWRAKMQEYLGVTPPTDTLGVLQDIHWAMASIGSFCTYTVGNVMSGQWMAAARREVDGLDTALANGHYAPLLGWLTDNIYRHARAFSPNELLIRATGEPLNPDAYLGYLVEKYTDIYK